LPLAYYHIKFTAPLLLKKAWMLLLLSFTINISNAQPIHFTRINSMEIPGMGNCWYTVIDQSGIFWISSNDGILSYDGYSIQHYSMETHPELTSNIVGRIFCDSKNRLWVSTGKMPVMLDENRRLHRVNIPGYKVSENIDRAIFEKPGGGYVTVTYEQCYVSEDGINNWKRDDFLTSVIGNKGLSDIKKFDNESLLLTVRNRKVMIVNFVKKKIVMEIPIPDVRTATRINDVEIIAGTESSWNLHRVNIHQQKIIASYQAPGSYNQNAINNGITQTAISPEKEIFIATQKNGLLKLNPATGVYTNYLHDFTDKTTISSNLLRHISITATGKMLITSEGGVDFTNLNYSVFNSLNYLQNNKSNAIRLNVNNVLPISKDRFLLAGLSGIYEWTPSLKQVNDFVKNGAPPSTKYPQLNAYTSYLDDNGNIWIGYEEGGIKVFNPQGLLIKKIDSSLPHLSIRCFEKGPGNQLFVGSTSGLFMIDTKNYAVDTFALQPTLAPMRHKKRLIDLLYHKNNLWMAVSPAGGVYKYDWQTRQLHKYDTSNGLISTRMYCLAVDQQDNIYAGSIHGLSIIKPNGEIYNLTKKNGLPGNRVESIISDNDGNLWFTTTKKISKYVPAEKKIYVFDHRNGINEVLFNVVNATKTTDGIIFFPTTSGLVYFDPQKIKYYAEPQKLNVTGSTDGVNFQALKPDSTIRFAYDKGKITFMVSGSDAGNNTLLFYRYKMEGVDTGWSRPSRNRSIAYSLRPGRYRFLAEASFDLVNFFPSS
jgi:ligand-binding sensor domain-containing protein